MKHVEVWTLEVVGAAQKNSELITIRHNMRGIRP
jgi:hypothetical protein